MHAVSRVIDIIMKSTTVDPILAEALAFFLLGTRNDIRVLGGPTNFYMLVVGPSSITHKSSAISKMLEGVSNTHSMGTMDSLAKALDEYNIGPDDEGWWTAPNGNDIVLVHDEFGQFLKSSKSGYVGWKLMVDVLNSLYACKHYSFPSTRGKSVHVDGVRVSLVASITPDAFQENASKEILEGGLFKRMLIIMPSTASYVPPWDLKDVEMPEVLDDWEPYIAERSPELTISDEVKESHAGMMLTVSESRDSVYGMWQRGERNIFKIAAINALLERNDTVINFDDYNRGLKLVAHSIGTQIAFLYGK